MQSIVFKLPDLGEGVVEAEIVAWHVKPGEDVRVDQPLVDVMTDKATVTIPSGLVGRVVRTHGNVGQTVAVGAQLVSFDTLDVEAERQPQIVEGSACLPLSMSAGSMPPLVQQAVSPTDNLRNGSHPQASPVTPTSVRRPSGQPGGAAACARVACRFAARARHRTKRTGDARRYRRASA